MPIYDLQNTVGQPHQRNFEIIAKVGSVNAIGSGTSKKDAKRSAASALLAKLKSMGNDVTTLSNIIPPSNGTANSVGDIEEELELAKGVSGMKIETLVSDLSKVHRSVSTLIYLQYMHLQFFVSIKYLHPTSIFFLL